MFEISIFSAFSAGFLSFISPCILPLVPVYISLMSAKAAFGQSRNMKLSERMFLLLNSIFFVLGFTVVFVILGSTATFFGRLLQQYSNCLLYTSRCV